ncbi:MAG: glutamate--cysteine ligase [Proteobacteria bacterium]|nr:glutamate--cysteine ligase [Pseudomonadota bacterium]
MASSPIYQKLTALLNERGAEVEKWFADQYALSIPHYNVSVDVRHSGYKIAPVDTNLFPAGFNLLQGDSRTRAVEETKKYFRRYLENVKDVVLIPENHTRNLYYLENVYSLHSILKDAGLNVRIGGLAVTEKTELQTQSGKTITVEPLSREGSVLYVGADKKFIPEIVVMNNDLSSGSPDILKNIDPMILPGIGFGWYRRRKTEHFEVYNQLVQRFSQQFNFDPWLISTSFFRCGEINFKDRTGIECVAITVDKAIHALKQKYAEHGITGEPYVFVKANSGTYGMGIMTARSGQDVIEINKKDRNKMNVIKEGTQNTDVIIQEGVPTVDTIDGKVAEPMLYLIGGTPVGCNYRVNQNRDAFSNLNSEGMTFKSACDADNETQDADSVGSSCPVLGFIARLAALAATQECYEPRWDI